MDTATENSNDAPNVINVDNAITGATAEEAVRTATTEQRQQRERDWESGIGPDVDPFWEQRKTNYVERKWGEPGAIKLKDAQSGLSNQKKLKSGRDYLARLEASDAGRAYLRNAGVSEITDEVGFQVGDMAAQFGKKPSELPTAVIGVARNDGKIHQPLDDLTPIDGSHGGNLREITKAQGNFREVVALQQQQLLAELEAQSAAEQQAGTPQQPAPQAPQPAPQPVQQQQPQQQRPDPVETERRRLAHETQTVAQIRQLSVAELQHAAAAKGWQDWARQNFQAELSDPAVLEHTRRNNPQRFAQLQNADQQIRQRQNAIAELGQQRVTRETQIGQIREQQRQVARRQYGSEQDKAFNDYLTKEYPQYASGNSRAELQRVTRELLKDAGLTSDEMIRLHYHDGVGVDMRAAGVQRVLAEAAIGRLMMQELQAARSQLASKRAPIPSVQKPGVSRPTGSDAEQNVRALERRLERASGQSSCAFPLLSNVPAAGQAMPEELYRFPPTLAQWMAGRTFDGTLMTREEGFARWAVILRTWEANKRIRMSKFQGAGILGSDEPDYAGIKARQDVRRQAGERIGDNPHETFALLDAAVQQQAERAEADKAQPTLDAIDQTLSPLLKPELAVENTAARITPAHKKAFAKFQACCARWELKALPASPQAVAVFLAESEPSQVSRLARSISILHTAVGFPDPCADVLVTALA